MECKLDEKGREIVSKKKVAIPAECRRPETINEKIRRLIKNEASIIAESKGNESFEEADDFEVGDEYEPTSQYEFNFDYEGEYSGAENPGFIEEQPEKPEIEKRPAPKVAEPPKNEAEVVA